MVYYICKYNDISNSDDIKVGQKIYVPVNNKWEKIILLSFFY